jgi:hypothetical protein
MRIAGILLAVVACCGTTEASAQFRAFVNVGGPGSGNAPAPGSAGLGTAGLGLGGFESATENLGRPGLGDAGIGSSPGLSFPLLNPDLLISDGYDWSGVIAKLFAKSMRSTRKAG